MHGFDDMDRRAVMERMLFLLGATAVPSAALAAAKPARAKHFPDPKSIALLSAIAETIVPKTDTPGALEAKVPEKLDRMLVTWAAPHRRTEIIAAMGRIDAVAMAQEGTGFAALSPEKRKKLLVQHDIAALRPVPRKEKLSAMEAMMAGPAQADPGYGKLKELIVLLYYYSEEALTTELVYEHVPGGWTPSVKVTPETRNSGGMGLF